MKIYLIAGEPSGDMLGARLMHALKELAPEAEFAGVGGENMKEEGLKSLFDISDLAVMGLFRAFRKFCAAFAKPSLTSPPKSRTLSLP